MLWPFRPPIAPQSFNRSRTLHFKAHARGIALAVFLSVVGATQAQAAERLELEVRETAGLARRGFPVHTRLKLPRPVPASTKFRLLSNGKPIVSQLRPEGDPPTANWSLDFQAEMSPNETKLFHVEFGDDVSEVAELARGHELTTLPDGFSITHAPYITWRFPSDLKSFVSSVAFESFEFLRPDSPGLLLRDRQSQQVTFSGVGKVVRQGHMTVALRYEKTQTEANLQGVRSTVDLTLPGPVSWVEVDWTIDDPHDKIAAAGLALDLNLDRPDKVPTLVDFGTSSVVYSSLYPDHQAELIARSPAMTDDSSGCPRWEILRRDSQRQWPFASQPKGAKSSDVEGWAHVMDRKKCLALAVDAFARDTVDRIGITADGKVSIWREYPAGQNSEPKHLRLWLHFVFFPPQASAGTSPQQMQSPLKVRQR